MEELKALDIQENDRRNYFMINLHESMGREFDPGPVPYFRGD